MKVHLIDTHLLVPRSRSSAKVKVKYQGNVSQKMGVLGAVVFHKHILFVKGLHNPFPKDKFWTLCYEPGITRKYKPATNDNN